jgi:hypothetical protein
MSDCGLGDEDLQIVYIQWVYLRAMGRPECAHDVLQLAHSQVISKGLPVRNYYMTVNFQSETQHEH